MLQSCKHSRIVYCWKVCGTADIWKPISEFLKTPRPSRPESKYWMIYRGPGFLASCDSAPRPHPPPFSRQQVASLSQSSCVPSIELTDGRGGGGGGRGAESKAWPSINHQTLWSRLFMMSPTYDLWFWHMLQFPDFLIFDNFFIYFNFTLHVTFYINIQTFYCL